MRTGMALLSDYRAFQGGLLLKINASTALHHLFDINQVQNHKLATIRWHLGAGTFVCDKVIPALKQETPNGLLPHSYAPVCGYKLPANSRGSRKILQSPELRLTFEDAGRYGWCLVYQCFGYALTAVAYETLLYVIDLLYALARQHGSVFH